MIQATVQAKHSVHALPISAGVPISAHCPRTPYHLRSRRYITEVTRNPTWTMKRPRSNIVMMVDAKRHRTSEAASVDQPPDYKTKKHAPQAKQAVGKKDVAGTCTEGISDTHFLLLGYLSLQAYNSICINLLLIGQVQTMCSTPSAQTQSNMKRPSDPAVVIAYKRRQRTPRVISAAANQQAIETATT